MKKKEMIILEFDTKNLSKKTIDEVIQNLFAINDDMFFCKTSDNRIFACECNIKYPNEHSVTLTFVSDAKRTAFLQNELAEIEVKMNRTIDFLSELKRSIDIIYPEYPNV